MYKVNSINLLYVIEYHYRCFPFIVADNSDVHYCEVCSVFMCKYVLRQHRIELIVRYIVINKPYISFLGETNDFEMYVVIYCMYSGCMHIIYWIKGTVALLKVLVIYCEMFSFSSPSNSFPPFLVSGFVSDRSYFIRHMSYHWCAKNLL